ncbi:DUF4350 domain-containing protein [Tenacibaculum sp. 190524A02b]|uniref:DUF4350 domain-containing protein n=1 Tax=Tenacibaculum vairaonense TaxID=3137860 RepID=UPI0031FA5E89
MKRLFFLSYWLLTQTLAYSQQIPDTTFIPTIEKRSYATKIYVDEAHGNFHTINNRFLPFATILRKAGYTVKRFQNTFSESSLKELKVLVISNALPQTSRPPFVAPTQSAFTKKEIESIHNWVANGGSLFLIADHMPFAGASEQLAATFGFKFYDSFLFTKDRRGIIDFSKENKMLSTAKLTSDNAPHKHINLVRTFTGQAFKAPSKATSILKTNEDLIVHLPDTMWRFSEKTKRFSAKNLSQGAIMNYKKGKIAFFGEAAMFTAQLAGSNRIKVGMNAKEAVDNYKLLLNIMHWLQSK